MARGVGIPRLSDCRALRDAASIMARRAESHRDARLAAESFLFKSVVQYLQIPLVKLIHTSQSHQGDRQLQRSQTRFPFFFATHWLIACRVWERNNSVCLLDVWRWFEVNVTEHPAQCLAHVECLGACEPSTPGYYAVMCSIAIIINDLGKQLQNNWLYLMWKFMLLKSKVPLDIILFI